jgi:hypothetical protein
LRYVDSLSDDDYSDLFVTIKRLVESDSFLKARQDQGHAKHLLPRESELERVQQEVCSILKLKLEAMSNLPLVFGNHRATQEGILIQTMATKFLLIADHVPQVVDFAQRMGDVLAEKVQRALETGKADFVQLLDQWPRDVGLSLESITDTFLFLSACESIASVEAQCCASIEWLQETFGKYCLSRDQEADASFHRMSALLSTLFQLPPALPKDKPDPSAPNPSESLTLNMDNMSTNQIRTTVEWMECQAAFCAFYQKHSDAPESKSMQLYLAFGKDACEKSAKHGHTVERIHGTLQQSVKHATPTQLHGAVLCARTWSQFDCVMAKEHQFETLRNDVEKNVLKLTSVLGDMRLDLEMGRYKDYSDKYDKADHTHPDFMELSEELSRRVRTLIGDAESSVGALDIGCCTVHHLQYVIQKLRELCDVQMHVRRLIAEDVQEALKPDQLIERVQDAMAGAVDSLEIRAVTEFRSGESTLRNLEEKASCFDQLGDAMKAFRAQTADKIKAHRKALQEALDAACMRYQGPGSDAATAQWVHYFEDWACQPPRELYEAIEHACESPNPMFPVALELLLSTLTEQLDAACGAIEAEADVDVCCGLAQALEEALRYLPTKLVGGDFGRGQFRAENFGFQMGAEIFPANFFLRN